MIYNMDTITIPEKMIISNAYDRKYRIELDTYFSNKLKINIKSINLTIPDNCDYIELCIGPNISLKYTRETIGELSLLPIIYLSRMVYHTLSVAFIFNKEWFDNNQILGDDAEIYISHEDLDEYYYKYNKLYYYGQKVIRYNNEPYILKQTLYIKKKRCANSRYGTFFIGNSININFIVPEIILKIETIDDNTDITKILEVPWNNNIIVYNGGNVQYKYDLY